MNRMQLAGIGVLGGALTVIGAIGPWATFHGVNLAGTDANRGKTVAISAGIGLLLLALAGWKNLTWAAILAAVGGMIACGLTIWSLAAINKFAGAPSSIPIGKGWGIWLATIGSIVLVLCAIGAALVKGTRTAVEPPPSAPDAAPVTPEPAAAEPAGAEPAAPAPDATGTSDTPTD
jgi:hypothetical protein